MAKIKKTVNEKISDDIDFCYCPRLGNSIDTLISKNPEGVSDERIAKVLLITQEEVEEIYASAIIKIRKHLKLDVD